MTVQFREKALIAYETMPLNQKNKVSHLIKQLDADKLQRLSSHILKSFGLDTRMVRVDKTVRLLFTKNDRSFLIIDIIDRQKAVL